jgi:hypothetical protein
MSDSSIVGALNILLHLCKILKRLRIARPETLVKGNAHKIILLTVKAIHSIIYPC